MKRIVVVGGGTGTYTVLKGLVKYPNLKLSAIVSMTDSGGSNRILRDEFGLLPTSDLRQCILGLASENSNEILRELFTYRYHQGTGISGMTFGNLFMAALTDIYGSQEIAIKKTCQLLQTKGDVIPVTFDNAHLVAKYDNGVQILGEHFIDEPNGLVKGAKIVEIKTIPDATANKNAIKAIKNADIIILGPGDLYTSIICNLIIGDMKNAFKKSRAKIIFVMNMMTKHGQTGELSAKDHTKELEKYLGRKIDICLMNSKPIRQTIVKWYKKFDSKLVKDDLKTDTRVKRFNMLADKIYDKHKGDKLVRSLVRHDSDRLAKAIVKFV